MYAYMQPTARAGLLIALFTHSSTTCMWWVTHSCICLELQARTKSRKNNAPFGADGISLFINVLVAFFVCAITYSHAIRNETLVTEF